MNIQENLKIINEKISNAELKAGRKPSSVKLMAVSKFHPANDIVEAIQSGQILFGENRVQEASEKFPAIIQNNPNVDLHLIGRLQSNKVKQAVKIFSCIQSVDKLELIKEIEKQCAKIEKKIKILLEVHTGEASKAGFEKLSDLEDALNFCESGKTPHIIVNGFMTMAPFTENKDKIRKSFSTLRNISERMKLKYPNMNFCELSMGMSSDFEIAIEEGSTIVRIGTAIFGERVYL